MSDPTHLSPGSDAPAAPSVARTAPAPGPNDRATYAKAINRGYGDAMGRGLELALTLVVMGGLGWLVDRLAGTYPLFTVIFSVVGFAGISVKLWLGYDLEMRKLDQDAVWSRGREDHGAGSADRATRSTGPGTMAS